VPDRLHVASRPRQERLIGVSQGVERQILFQVELPLGLPLVMAGIRIAAIFVIATATIAAVAGGSDLGEVIVNPASYGLAGVVGASYCVSALTLLAAVLLGWVTKFASRRPEPDA